MEFKVIAVKLPFDLQERVLAFPFLHALRERYPKAELHFITPKKEIEVLNLLPFTAYYHEFDEDEISNVFDAHRFSANAKIYNVDLFITLTNSFVDACLGYGLRAKRRIGFGDNFKSWVLSNKLPRLPGHHLVEDYFSLFKEIEGTEVNARIKVMSRDLDPIVTEFMNEPYITINLSPLRDRGIESEWIQLISQFENQKIVLFFSDEQVRAQLLMETFLATLPKKNRYVNFWYKNWIELARMLAHARGVISYSGAAGATAAYVGTRSLLLYENEDPQKLGPFYFLSDVSIMGVNNPTLVNQSLPSTQALKDRTTFNMEEVAKKAFEFFKLS